LSKESLIEQIRNGLKSEILKGSYDVTVVSESASLIVLRITLNVFSQNTNLDLRLEEGVINSMNVEKEKKFVEGVLKTLFIQVTAAFYENFDCLAEYKFDQDRDLVLVSDFPGCRFCGLADNVTFDDKAHALPASTGNKFILSDYECDYCNYEFGRTIDDHFGRWSNWQRTLFRIRGNRGVPAFSLKGGHIRLEDDQTEIQLSDEITITFSEDLNEATLEWKNLTYIPSQVRKCFYKMALALMPDSELAFFQEIQSFINPRNNIRRIH